MTALDQRFPALVSLLDTHLAKPGDKGSRTAPPTSRSRTLPP
ncbi:hypothetical protein [Frankia sp. AiPa1]|nr:hypothetical protein [Frankia sp. AiPa1]